MELTSGAFRDGERMPSKHTCDGANTHPPLSWDGVPEGTRSLALIMEDPDVPRQLRPDGMFDHWLHWNIPASARAVGEGEELPGVSGKTTHGMRGYFGPCPPDREHRYFFKLYALDTLLDLSPDATKDELLDAADGHVLDRAELVGRYERARRKGIPR
ncbi:MAG: YbhB/YbcL family Raf kinase inhibitor-like protein [Candidatus Colwellbacteria bacterium]|nr:YbhB/YbcL family Raf kinase inhibitor-like protein [Candidatus Colwellbacteria bacterium]